MASAIPTKSKARTITLWILRILIAALFAMAALAKLSGQPMMVAEFDKVGLGQWFRYFTATLELIGAVTVLVPGKSSWGAMLLLLVDIGAFVTQLTILHGDIIHTIVIGAILAAIIYLQRASPALSGKRMP